MFQACAVKIAKIAASSAPKIVAGKKVEKEGHREGEKAEDRHRLQDVEQWNEDQSRRAGSWRQAWRR